MDNGSKADIINTDNDSEAVALQQTFKVCKLQLHEQAKINLSDWLINVGLTAQGQSKRQVCTKAHLRCLHNVCTKAGRLAWKARVSDAVYS